MSQFSVPQQGILVGDASRAPYDADEWSIDYTASLFGFPHRANYGVILGYDDGSHFSLEVTPTSVPSNQVELKIGAALVRGTVYINDAALALTVQANASGNPRIDTVVLRKDYVLQTIRAAIVQGSPAASPVPPTLTQTAGLIWEIPLANISVANGFSTIVDRDVKPVPRPTNSGDGINIDQVVNNSGGALAYGDVVIWNIGTARSVTTTTQANNTNPAGIMIDTVANGARGRIMTRGFAKIRLRVISADGSPQTIGVGTPLVTGYTAKYATIANLYTNVQNLRGTNYASAIAPLAANTAAAPAYIGRLMEAVTIAAGATFDDYVLAFIDVPQVQNAHVTTYKFQTTADAGNFASGAWRIRLFTHVGYGNNTALAADQAIALATQVNNYASISVAPNDTITLQPGIYYVRGYATAYRCDSHRVRIQNTTDATTFLNGTAAYSPSAADSSQTLSIVEGYIIIQTAKAIQLQHRCGTTRNTDGLGKYDSFGDANTYALLQIERRGDIYG
jgi:hypothetical protein